MRTNIDIDDKLMEQAMVASKATTKKAAVEAALKLMVQLEHQGNAIESLRGKIVWRGHDDDWFASDEEVQAERKRTPAGEQMDSASEEQSRLAGEQGLR
ncbi:type II toxin-antitoxin system VapB family antitoxin [Acidicapsa acidisoli]|uniref:type II toxin-antitoxin system VapB family antitoxin n=1 Tax=Acidicapsa acidisoli TaxID=1615681 RepID=UPI0021DF7981|nr:type II toxin-antitoxin system VapB family antitoxin [Acidicapsa acidisoli]